MTIREIETLDGPRILRLFEKQGIDYQLPDLRELVSRQAVESEGLLVQAVLARPTLEIYFLQDPEWRTPAWRMEAFRKIHESSRREVHAKGFHDMHAFLPPSLEKSFGERLMQDFHWTHPLWFQLTRPSAPQNGG